MRAAKFNYIPDKSMYAAVMKACEAVRKKEDVDKACTTYALYFRVNEEKLTNLVLERLNMKPTEASVKYRWFIVETCLPCDAAPSGVIRRVHTCRSRNAESACLTYANTNCMIGDTDGYISEADALRVIEDYKKARYAE